MPRGVFNDADHLHDVLDKAVLLIEDGVEGDSVDLNDPSPVYVGIIVEVSGYGPHVGAMYVYQNKFYAPGTPLQEAHQILEEWMIDRYPEHLEDLEKEWGDDALSILTETFDGWAFELSPHDFVRAIQGTKAEGLVDIIPREEDENLEEPSGARRHRHSTLRRTADSHPRGRGRFRVSALTKRDFSRIEGGQMLPEEAEEKFNEAEERFQEAAFQFDQRPSKRALDRLRKELDSVMALAYYTLPVASANEVIDDYNKQFRMRAASLRRR